MSTIDLGSGEVRHIFAKMFYPTVLGMLFSALFCITDGIFVGRGLGSDALAAVNIVAPMFLISTGVGLMAGMGASVVASIHLSKGKMRAARIVSTQAIAASSLFLLLCSAVAVIFMEHALQLFGCSERLLTLAKDYFIGFVPFMAINGLACSTGFFVRLDGSPKFAMAAGAIASVLNVILDYLFIFPLQLGIFGAAVATIVGTAVGVAMTLWYLMRRGRQIRLVRLRTSWRNARFAVRNLGRVCRLGFSSLLSETAVACMMLCGNYVFISRMGEDGVAAFSIACYFFPIIFMLYNSIMLSAQPIMSFNYGAGKRDRVRKAFGVALRTALGYGSVLLILTVVLRRQIVAMFIAPTVAVYDLAVVGMPLFALGFVPFAVNILAVGYFQSVERAYAATAVTVLRGYILPIICFITLPNLLGDNGAWLAVCTAEIITFVIVVAIYLRGRRRG